MRFSSFWATRQEWSQQTESWLVARQFPGGQFACNRPSTKTNKQTNAQIRKKENTTKKIVITNISLKKCKEYKDALYLNIFIPST